VENLEAIATVASVFLIFVLLEVTAGDFLQRKRTKVRDVWLDFASGILVPGAIMPLVLFASASLAQHLFPADAGAWSAWPAWLMFVTLCIGDDLSQYWWHRLSHTRWLFPLHRAHHSAPYLSVRVVYRNNIIYYALMPGLWVSGGLIYAGFGSVYACYVVAKLFVITSAHSNVQWDRPLLRFKTTRVLLWLLERTISTPMTHAAHHGLNGSDPATHYKGNFGNLLFIWDIIFGTAKITRSAPTAFGVEGLVPVPWWREFTIPKKTSYLAPESDSSHSSPADTLPSE
jgi:sterol desaturase/sphingolipid hydroxylase (fatty acid hydroxylase superfamily)